MGKRTYSNITDEEVPSMDCSSPVSSNDIYIPDYLQSGYRPLHMTSSRWASPRTSRNVSSKFTESGFIPWGDFGIEESLNGQNSPKKEHIFKKRREKRLSPVVSEPDLNKPSPSPPVQQNEHVPKSKKQKFLFEDTPISYKKSKSPEVESEVVVEHIEKPRKHKKNIYDDVQFREFNLDTPSTSSPIEDQTEHIRKPKKQRFLFEDTPITCKKTENPESPIETTVEHTKKSKKDRKNKHDDSLLRELNLNEPSTSHAAEEQTEKKSKKQQRLLFEDTPVTRKQTRDPVDLNDQEPEITEKPKKHKKNKYVDLIRSCLDVNTPSTSRNEIQEHPKSKKSKKHERIAFEVLPTDSILDDTDTSCDEVLEIQEPKSHKRSRAKSVEQWSNLSSSLLDSPSTSTASTEQDKCYKKSEKKSYLFDDSKMADTFEETIIKESKSEKRQRAKSEMRQPMTTEDTPIRSRIEQQPINGNRPKKKVSFETQEQQQPSTSGLARSASIKTVQPTPEVWRKSKQRLENDTRPKDRLQRLEEAAKEDKRKKKDPTRSFPDLSTFKIRKTPGEDVAKEIRALQKSTRLLLEKKPLKRVVKEITTEVSSGIEYRYTKNALEALQESAEAFLVEFFSDLKACAKFNGRETIDVKDIKLTRRLQKW